MAEKKIFMDSAINVGQINFDVSLEGSEVERVERGKFV